MLRRIAVIATTAGMVAANVWIAAAPLFGRTTAEVSARYPVLVTPAGYTFAIWGLIYLAMLIFSTAQFVERGRTSAALEGLAGPVILSNFVNVLWLVAWHALVVSVSVLLMFILLACLGVAYTRAARAATSALDRWTVRAPLSLYLGWISVATIANVSAALYSSGWRGGPVPGRWWAVIMLLIAGSLALIVLLRNSDPVFPSVVAWALVGIAVGQEAPLVVWTAIAVGSVLVLATASMITTTALKSRRPTPENAGT